MNKYKIIKYIVIKGERARVVMLFAGMLILGFFEMAGVASIVPFMSIVTDTSIIFTNKYLNYLYVQLNFSDTDSFLLYFGLLVLAFIATANFYSIYMNWKMQQYVFRQENNIAIRTLYKYLSQDYVFFLSRNSSDLNKNILTEIGRAMSGVFFPMLQVLSKSIITIMLILLLVVADPSLALTIFIALGGVYIFIFILVRRVLHKIGNVVADTITQRYKILSEIFSSIKILKLKGGEEDLIKYYSNPSTKYARYSAISTVISHAPRYLLEVIAFGGIMVIVLYLISKGQSNSYVISYMALYAFAGYRLLPALQAIYSNLTLIHYNFPALEAIVTDLKIIESDIIKPKQLKDGDRVLEDNIEFKNINFKYPQTEEYLLKNINLSKIDIVKSSTEIRYDLFISNPPYIGEGEIEGLEKNVKDYEPTIALTDNEDGYKFYKKFSETASKLVKTGGYVILEVGIKNHPEEVSNIFSQQGYFTTLKKDYNGDDRVLIVKV